MSKLNKFTFSHDPKSVIDVARDEAMKLKFNIHGVNNTYAFIFPIKLHKNNDKEFVKFLHERYNSEYYKEANRYRNSILTNYNENNPLDIFAIVPLKQVFENKRISSNAPYAFISYMRDIFDRTCFYTYENVTTLTGKLEYEDFIKSVDI